MPHPNGLPFADSCPLRIALTPGDANSLYVAVRIGNEYLQCHRYANAERQRFGELHSFRFSISHRILIAVRYCNGIDEYVCPIAFGIVVAAADRLSDSYIIAVVVGDTVGYSDRFSFPVRANPFGLCFCLRNRFAVSLPIRYAFGLCYCFILSLAHRLCLAVSLAIRRLPIGHHHLQGPR